MKQSTFSDSGMSLAAVRPLLKRLGLHAKEVDVYLALLEMKMARASALALRAGQSRSHTYLLLRELAKRGLVSEVDRGGVLHFVAEPPSSLLLFAEDRSRELQETGKLLGGALPLLESLSAPMNRAPRVTLLHGFNGTRQIYKELFRDEYCSLFNPEPMYAKYGKNLAQDLLPDGLYHGRDLLIDNEATQRFIKETTAHEGHQIRLLPKDVVFPTDNIVRGDTVALFAYDEDMTIVRIENRNIADTFRAWFDAMWPMGRPIRK